MRCPRISIRNAGRVLQHETPWGAALLQFVPAVVLFISSSPTFHISLSSAGNLSVWFKLQGIYSVFDSGNRLLDVPYFLSIATMAVAAASLRAISFHSRAWVAFWMLTGAFLALPEVFFGSAYASYRLFLAVVLFAIAASDPRPANRWVVGPAGAMVSILFLVRSAVIVEAWHGYDDEHRQVIDAAHVMQEGSRVLPYVVQQDSYEFIMKPPILHLATLAVIYRHAFVPTLFTDPSQQPLRISAKYESFHGSGHVRTFLASCLRNRLTIRKTPYTKVPSGNLTSSGCSRRHPTVSACRLRSRRQRPAGNSRSTR